MPAFAIAATGEELFSMRKFLNRRTIGSGSVLALVAGLSMSALPSTPVAAKPIAAQQPTSYTVSLVPQKVVSSTHKRLNILISGSHNDNSALGGGQTSSESVFIGAKGARDTHNWGLPLSAHAVDYSAATGKGTFKSGKKAKPYSVINLRFHNKGKRNVTTCHAYKTISQPVVLKGRWKFNTHSHGNHKWGKKGRHGKFRGTINYSLGNFQSCGNTHFPCFQGMNWSGVHPFGSSFNEISFSGSVNRNSIFATRNVSLAKPKNASRIDNVSLTDNHQKFSLKNGKATVKIGPAPGVSGSATLNGPQGSQGSPQACGKGHTQTTTSWGSSYKNGSKPLTVKEQIEGPLKLPNISQSAGRANISKTTVHN
jgi:hypothetical protein